MQDKSTDTYDKLFITDELDTEQSNDIGHKFVISEELRKTTTEEYDYFYSVLSNSELELSTRIPMYEISWTHIISGSKGRLHELVLLSMQLERTLSEKDPDILVCDSDLDRGYLSVVEDISAEYGVDAVTDSQSTVSTIDLIKRFLKNTFLILPFLFDEIFSILWKHVKRKNKSVELAFIPSWRRLSSMLPVISKTADSDYENYRVFCTSKVSSQGRGWKLNYLKSDLEKHTIEPLSSFVSVKCILRQFSGYVQVNKNLLLKEHIIKQLVEIIDHERDIKLENTIRYSVYEGFRVRVMLSIFFYELTNEFIKKSDCNRIVVGGLAPTRRAIAIAGLDNNAHVYLVDHGIQAGDCPNPPSGITHLTSGKLEQRQYKQSPQVQEPWNWVMTGRPYLVDLFDKYKNAENNKRKDDRFQILVATQPIRCRKEFVTDVIDAVSESHIDAKIVIKTHPSEQKGEYAEYENEENGVFLYDDQLFKHLSESDLTLTVFSNVGIESILAGTPVACVNKWAPSMVDPSYAKYGPIPILRSRTELSKFLTEQDTTELEKSIQRQEQFAHDNFKLETDAAANMMEEILP